MCIRDREKVSQSGRVAYMYSSSDFATNGYNSPITNTDTTRALKRDLHNGTFAFSTNSNPDMEYIYHSVGDGWNERKLGWVCALVNLSNNERANTEVSYYEITGQSTSSDGMVSVENGRYTFKNAPKYCYALLIFPRQSWDK